MATSAPVMEIGEIWQSLPHRRDVYKIQHLELLKEAMIFQTKLPIEFDQNFPIFIKINYKNLIFKLSGPEFKIYNNQLSCSYPTEAKALEHRSIERTKLPKKSNLNITLRALGTGIGQDFKVALEDISEGGIGIRINNANVEHFKERQLFKIIKVCGQQLIEEATLSVRHISLKDLKSFVSVGMAADASFSFEFFEIIKNEIGRNRFGPHSHEAHLD